MKLKTEEVTSHYPADYAAELAELLVESAHAIALKGLTWGPSGNISVRISDSDFFVSASGAILGDLDREDVVRCTVHGDVLTEWRTPSLETDLHRALYAQRSSINVVLHASPFYATLVSASSLDPDPALTVDSAYYLRGGVRRVAFHPPGSQALAEATVEAASHADVLLLDNHGVVLLGPSLEQATTRLECFENLCKMTILGALGLPLRVLDGAKLNEMMEALKSGGAT
jgi:3-dehydro-4-phosphotetronate decarboxylase